MSLKYEPASEPLHMGVEPYATERTGESANAPRATWNHPAFRRVSVSMEDVIVCREHSRGSCPTV